MDINGLAFFAQGDADFTKQVRVPGAGKRRSSRKAGGGNARGEACALALSNPMRTVRNRDGGNFEPVDRVRCPPSISSEQSRLFFEGHPIYQLFRAEGEVVIHGQAFIGDIVPEIVGSFQS